jgi:putative DNA primase/helicase
MQAPDGKMSAKCLHESCSGLGWQAFKEQIGKPDRDHYDPPLKRKAKKKTRSQRIYPCVKIPDKQDGTTVTLGYHLTDYGNAQRLATLHSSDIHFVYQLNKWLAWEGKRWRLDYIGEVERLAKKTVRNILREAAEATKQDEREALVDWALKSENASRIQAMIALARSEPKVAILPDSLDNDARLLNCENGTLDLRTGNLRKHQRSDLITKLCPVEYHPTAEAPRFHEFLRDIFEDDPQLIGFIQRLLGHCLTGDVSEQVLPIFWGAGANGKSTLLNTILAMLGSDYGIKAAPELLMKKQSQTHPTERADLFGKRFVACVETEEGCRLAESLVKDLTGGDRQRARRMREDFWEFAPTHKVVLCTNHKPQIRGTDHAIWRRVRLIPFAVTVPPERRDKQLGEKLKTELPGILAWIVQGCLEWQQYGLGEPERVAVATSEYRNEQDVLGAFMADCCLVGHDYRTKASGLYKAYRQWCDNSGERHPITQRQFGAALTERGCERYTNNGTWYRGLALQDPDL